MIPQYRDYQQQLADDIRNAWSGSAVNVCATLPTGGGKTVIFSGMIAEHAGYSCAIAHRQELVSQISVALARCGVRHRIIAPDAVVRRIVALQVEDTGRSCYDPRAHCAVAGVDTLIKRKPDPVFEQWRQSVTLWVQDECHHVLNGNKWGKAAAMFPRARGLGVTATPCRADGKGLGRHADGLFDALVSGPSMRELIDRGFLCDYRVIAHPSDIMSQLRADDVSASTGDYKPEALRKAAKQSHIVGDVVEHYKRFAAGKLGITFATDVETATAISAQFNAAGVPAEVVSAKTPDTLRAHTLRRFRARELLQLVNVDLFGEGFDLPAIECVSFARPTESFSLYAQQFGRALRPMEGKSHAVVIDHVGNIVRHGLPDRGRVWSLDGREKRGKRRDGEIPIKSCVECFNVYESFRVRCPHCGHKPEPSARSAPEFVEGDLTELDPAVLARLRGDVARVAGPALVPQDVAPYIAASIRTKHAERKDAQQVIRECVRWWAGYQSARGLTDAESYRLFWYTFGVDVMTAQTLGRPEAFALADRVAAEVGRMAQ